MAGKRKIEVSQKPIEQYEHKDKQRLNNPPVGLVDANTDNGGLKKKKYTYDPHLDPQLQWAGKAEHTSFDVPTVSLHVHERIDPRKIIESVRKEKEADSQPSLFESDKKPLREAIEFYKHKENWSNRLVAGDSLLVMNSLLEKEGMGGKGQMVYFDPPYGIKYGSNFQPFVNKRDVKDGKDEDLTAEPEMIKAFRDTWELGIHSYLTYLRDRLLLARELLHESGSVFVQISDENVHHVRELMDEVFGSENFVSMITFSTTSGFTSNYLSRTGDYLIWYSKDKRHTKYRQVYSDKSLGIGESTGGRYDQLESPDGKERRPLSTEERKNPNLIPKGWKPYKLSNPCSMHDNPKHREEPLVFENKPYFPPKERQWSTDFERMRIVIKRNRLVSTGSNLAYVMYLDDYPVMPINNIWTDVLMRNEKTYVVETSPKSIERCLVMTTDPGDLVLDITCGSGTTAYVAENWGRRWMTCDTSRVAVTLAKP